MILAEPREFDQDTATAIEKNWNEKGRHSILKDGT